MSAKTRESGFSTPVLRFLNPEKRAKRAIGKKRGAKGIIKGQKP
jgi:hypothetical protein